MRVTKPSRLGEHLFSSKSLFTVKKVFFLFRNSVARAKIGTQLGLASLQGGKSGEERGCGAAATPGAQPVQELPVPQGEPRPSGTPLASVGMAEQLHAARAAGQAGPEL